MRQTPLYAQHLAGGGKVVDFHGWALPLQFKGIIDEHHYTRNHASLFDCSHMGEFLIRGEDGIRAFDYLVFNDMIDLKPGRCRYSSLLNGRAGIIDDIVALKLSEDELYVVTNAGPLEKVAQWISMHTPDVENLSDATAKIDVQGPKAREVMLHAGIEPASWLKFYCCCRTQWRGVDIVVTRAGYTGELGYELFVPNDMAGPLWECLLTHPEAAPAGLGARDTLRLEMGYSLYGQDIDENRTSLESNMGRFIQWNHEFVGRSALCFKQEHNRFQIRTGIQSNDRRAPRAGQEVRHNSRVVGVVTSGTFGPTVGTGIGMAYIENDLAAPGTPLTVGPKDLPVVTVEFPLYKGGSLRA